MRFLGAIFDAGLNRSFEKAQSRLTASVEREQGKGYWSEAGRERAGSSAADTRAEVEQGGSSSSNGGGSSRRPPWASAHSSYQPQTAAGASSERSSSGVIKAPSSGGSPPFRDVASATARYLTAPSLPRGRSELGPRASAHTSAGGSTSYERGGGVSADKLPASSNTFASQQQQDVNMGAAAFTHQQLGSASSCLSGLIGRCRWEQHEPSLASSFTVQGTSSPWSSTGAVAPSWSNSNVTGTAGIGGFVELPATAAGTDLNAALDSLVTQPKTGNSVMPLAADIGKNSIEGLAACLNTRDLTYWQDILGFDLATPAV